MTSVGVMASGVVSGAPSAVPFFTENFDDVSEYTTITPTLRTGRTGIAGAITGSSQAVYAIPSGNQTDSITIGFWLQVATLTANRVVLVLATDGNTINQMTMLVRTDGTVEVRIGGTVGALVASSSAGTIVAGTWTYIELQIKMHDTVGFVVLSINGAVVSSALNIDTKVASTKTVYDTVQLSGAGTGVTNKFDDLYIASDGGAALGVQRYGTGPNVVLDDNCNSLANWTTTGGSPTIVAGRNGNGISLPSTGAFIQCAIASGAQSYMVTVGFAAKFVMTANGNFFQLRSDAGATQHITLTLNTDGSLQVVRGTISTLVTSATGLVVAGTWYYVELQALLHDTAGAVTLRLDGTVVASVIDVDTKNAGTLTVLDTVRLLQGGGPNPIIDDVYIRSGTLADFLGDHVIP